MKAKVKDSGEIIEVKEWRGASDVIYSTPDMNKFYAENELELFSATSETFIEGWVARDSNGDINIFDNKPENSYNDFWMNKECWYLMKDVQYVKADAFPDLTFNNSPKKVRITITPIEE